MTTTVVSAARTTSTSSWPTPTVSMITTSLPMAAMTVTTPRVEAVSPPKWPRVARERMNTPSSVAWRCMRTRSPRMAPPLKGLVGSTATTPTVSPFSRYLLSRASVRVDLPTPGEPVMPMMRARCWCG